VWQLLRTHGSYRVAHLAAAMAGIRHAQLPRPVLPLSGAAARQVELVLAGLGLE